MDTENNEKETPGTGLQATPAESMPQLIKQPESIIGTNGPALTQILMDNITKVQSDPNYIPQAQAVSENIGQIIQLAKTQIEMFKVANQMQSGK
jgi:hypothetical protein